MKRYDIGIFGVWSGCNYGSIATYYALNRVITSMGKTVLMIDKPVLFEDDVELKETHSRRFAREHYDISEQYRLDEFEKLNDQCDVFIMGSDQVWNYEISKNFGKRYYLDFVSDDKVKIAYAASFGHSVDFASAEERKKISALMKRFDGVSVREEDGVRICREDYGVEATRVLDPVFLADRAIFDELAEKSTFREEEPFIATYILDPDPEIRKAIFYASEKLGGIKVINLLDGLPWTFEENKNRLELPNCIENLQVEDWLYYIKNAEFVITDSCHGASFSIIFERNFIAIGNKRRGMSRFRSLIDLFKLDSHFTVYPEKIINDHAFFDDVDYGLVNTILQSERKRCYNWLKSAISANKNRYLDFSVDNDYWEKHCILGNTCLITKYPNSDGGKYAVLKLNEILEKDVNYVLSLQFKVMTSSPFLNLHIMKSGTKTIQVIYSHQIDQSNEGKWNKIEIEFSPDEEGMDSFMVGALQICGENRFLLIKSLNIEKK